MPRKKPEPPAVLPSAKSPKLIDRIRAAKELADIELAGIVQEMGTAADRALLKIIQDGVPIASEGHTPHTSAYVSALALALKRTGRLIEKAQVEHSGEVRAAVLLPMRELVKRKT